MLFEAVNEFLLKIALITRSFQQALSRIGRAGTLTLVRALLAAIFNYRCGSDRVAGGAADAQRSRAGTHARLLCEPAAATTAPFAARSRAAPGVAPGRAAGAALSLRGPSVAAAHALTPTCCPWARWGWGLVGLGKLFRRCPVAAIAIAHTHLSTNHCVNVISCGLQLVARMQNPTNTFHFSSQIGGRPLESVVYGQEIFSSIYFGHVILGRGAPIRDN